MSPHRALHWIASSLLATACVFEPDGLDDEQARAAEAGRPFEPEFAQRPLPELDSPVSWQALLARAFAADGDLEAAWARWSAALEQVAIAGGWPDTGLAPSLGYLVAEDRMKTWDRTTLTLGFDPMKNLSWPSKVGLAAEVALAEAQAAGRRFEAEKFALQRRILEAWLELALHEEQIRLQREEVTLATIALQSATRRVETGGAQGDLLRARVELDLAENELAAMDAQHHAMKVALNGAIARPPEAPIDLAQELPAPRPIAAGDDEILGAGVDRNPELAALAAQVRGREDAVDLARAQFIPDFNPFVAVTGDVAEMIGVGISLPTMIPQLRAAVRQSRALLREAGAMERQARFERGAQLVAELVILRDAERQAAFLESAVLPVTRRAEQNLRDSYSAGRASLLEVIDAQRALIEVRRAIAESRIERELRLAALEELGGFDVETLATQEDSDVDSRP